MVDKYEECTTRVLYDCHISNIFSENFKQLSLLVNAQLFQSGLRKADSRTRLCK